MASIGPARPRRAPAPEDRQVDAERSRAALLDAALHEFSDKGFAGARVRDIAARAGVSKDLIAYHFGGKDGLYRAVQQAWLDRRDEFAEPDLPLDESVARYLHDALTDPCPMRLLVLRGLAGPGQAPPVPTADASCPSTGRPGTGHPDAGHSAGRAHAGYPDVVGLRRRQERGELDGDIDPATLQLVLLGAVAAPVVFGDIAHHLFGVRPGTSEFEDRYREGLRHILRALRAPREEDS